MKKLTTIGFITAVLVFIAALYLQFVIVPHWHSLSDAMDYENGYQEVNMYRGMALRYQSDKKLTFAMIVLCSSIIPLILCAISAIKNKKQLLAWLGIALSLFALVAGLENGTHLFS